MSIIKNIINAVVSKKGYELRAIINRDQGWYVENEEVGPSNIEVKRKRVLSGGSFELPEMIILNRVVAKNLVGSVKKVINVGCGVGTFERIASSMYPDVSFTASEYDEESLDWCKSQYKLENVVFTGDQVEKLLKKNGKYDLAISIDVIEHIKEYASFILQMKELAEVVVITTPNKARNSDSLQAMPPKFTHHIREWTSGEFYWVLRAFFSDVELYSLDDKEDILVPIGVLSERSPLIAVCKGAIG